MLKAGSYSSLSQQASKVWHSKEDVLFGYKKDILFGGNGADILAALTDKGQNRLYGGGDRDPIRWRQRQAIWRGSEYLGWQVTTP